MASENIKLVYGGGKCGLMGKLSEEVSKNKGKIKGISLPMFDDIGVTPKYLDELEIQENFYTRKQSLIEQSDFFVIMVPRWIIEFVFSLGVRLERGGPSPPFFSIRDLPRHIVPV